jgi:hypothetical protein
VVIQCLMILTGNVENTCRAVCSLVDISSAVWASRLRGRSRRAAELVAQAPDVIVITGTEATAILQPVTMEKLL